MFKRWSRFLVAQHIIQPEDAEIQEYGLFCLVETVSFNLTQLILAVLAGLLPETLVFDAAFLLLRSHAGGFHASTPARCFAMSIGVWAAVMLTCRHLPTGLWIVLALPSLAVIWRLAPLPHENNPFTPARLAQVTRRLRGIVLALSLAAGIVLAAGSVLYARLILAAFSCTAFSLWLAKRRHA